MSAPHANICCAILVVGDRMVILAEFLANVRLAEAALQRVCAEETFPPIVTPEPSRKPLVEPPLKETKHAVNAWLLQSKVPVVIVSVAF